MVFLLSTCSPDNENPTPEGFQNKVKTIWLDGKKIKSFSYDNRGRILTDSTFDPDEPSVFSLYRYVYGNQNVTVYFLIINNEYVYSQGKLNPNGQIERLSLNRDTSIFTYQGKGRMNYKSKMVLVANSMCNAFGNGIGRLSNQIWGPEGRIDSVFHSSYFKAGEPRPNPEYIPGVNDSILCVFQLDSTVKQYAFTYDNPKRYKSAPANIFGLFLNGLYSTFQPTLSDVQIPGQVHFKSITKRNSSVSQYSETKLITDIQEEGGLLKSFHMDGAYTIEYYP